MEQRACREHSSALIEYVQTDLLEIRAVVVLLRPVLVAAAVLAVVPNDHVAAVELRLIELR